MKILVLGSNGMLGRYMYRFLSKEYDVINWDRNRLDLNLTSKQELKNELQKEQFDIVINCSGVIKPRVNEVGTAATIKINSWLPHILNEISQDLKFNFIHITTDCVFSGKKGNYTEQDYHDPEDIYGKSKSLGEPNKLCTTIRTSIIGEEVNQNRSLISWAISQKNKQVNGFIDHKWNGVTCLQLSKFIDTLIKENKFNLGLFHYFSESITKDKLLKKISDVYNLNLKIEKIKSPNGKCDRTLATNREDTSQFINLVPSLLDQLIEMKNFKLYD